MAPIFNNRKSEPDSEIPREPLVDVDLKPPQSDQPASALGLKVRRRRLSDVDAKDRRAEPQPQPKLRRCRLTSAPEVDPGEPPVSPPSQPESARPRLVDITEAPTSPPPRSTAPRPRGATGPQPTDMPGLHTVERQPSFPGETPHSSDVPVSVQTDTPPLSERRARLEGLLADLRATQDLRMAVLGGMAAAGVGGLIWTAVTAAMGGDQLGWMAIGVGFLVGSAVRILGRGVDRLFGCLGAVMAILGCLLGKFLIAWIGPGLTASALIVTFHPLDLLFYGIAIYEGYWLSFRRFTEKEISRVVWQD